MNEPAIFIESKPVDFGSISTGKDHLYLVFQDSDGSETVIRGGPDTNNPLGVESSRSVSIKFSL